MIVEAGGFTHSALTTKIATELGRDIAVVPGRVTDPSGERILWLLQDGAHPVASAEHVLEVINGAGLRGPALHDPAPHELADDPTWRPRLPTPRCTPPRSTTPPCTRWRHERLDQEGIAGPGGLA